MLSDKPVFVALDLDDTAKVIELSKQLKGVVGGFKLGPRLLIREGQELIKEIAKSGPVFVDNKYYDIPNTMETAVRATFEAGASFCTVHASSGEEALTRLAALQDELSDHRPFQILGVTILTSFSEDSLPSIMKVQEIKDHVRELAELTTGCGINGMVCSPFEVADLAERHKDGFFVVPGVRLAESSVKNDDQKRVMTPKQALQKGASALVIGRPIVAADDPVRAAEEIMASLS